MRTLLMVLMIAGLMSTVGVYAAGLGGAPTIKTLGGTGTATVSGPGTTVSVSWNFTADAVTGADVTWTPTGGTLDDYTIRLTAGGNSGSVSCVDCGTSPRTDTVTLASTEADAIVNVKVVISQD